MIENQNMVILGRFEEYLNQIELSPKTITNYLTDLRTFTRWAEGKFAPQFQLSDVTPAQIRAYRDYLLQEQNRASSTINRHLQAIRKCCAYMAQTNLAPSNAALEIGLVSVQKPQPIHPVSGEELSVMFSAANSGRTSIAKRDTAILHLLIKAGLRVAEIADLQMEDVVFDYPGVHLTIRDSRNNGTRDIPLCESVCHALKEWLVIRPKASAFPQVFLSQEGKPVSARTVQRIVSRCATAANLNGITAQFLRRTYALDLLEETGNIELVSHRLGHQDQNITRQYLNLGKTVINR